ncbi:MAG TPA: histidinol-phosphate transaminase [Terriglobia bacterium]|nr:histidinol-phosphate transaminase [Terriglobia bacterium]
MQRSSFRDLLPRWASHIRPYPTGKPVEEVERELGRTAVKLASNENPLGPSPKAIEAICQTLRRIHLYPDSSGYELRKRLAEFHQLEMNQIILGAGSTELIELAAKTFLSVEDEGVSPESSFLIYRLAIEETGATLALAPLRDRSIDLDGVRQIVTPRTKVVYLANPNNPTGTLFTAAEFDRFLNALPAHVLVVLDEAYCDYVERADYSHALDYVRGGKNVLVLRTFSKVYGLAGLRVGYGMGHSELIESLNRVRAPFNTSRPSQAAALAALGDQDHVAQSVESNAREMRFVSEELTLLGVKYTPSSANFLLIDTGRDCEQDFLRLLEEGVIVRPMKMYGFPSALRVTLGTHQDNELFLEALQHILFRPPASLPEP